MPEVFAGFVCGFTLSIIATPPFAIWVLLLREDVPFIRYAIPKGMPITLLSVPIASFFFLIWTGLGRSPDPHVADQFLGASYAPRPSTSSCSALS